MEPVARVTAPMAVKSHTSDVCDYRLQLKAELRRRIAANPRYSLRSFARTVGLSPAFLSKVLNGQKNISGEKAAEVAQRLGYSRAETAEFCKLVQIGGTSSPELKAVLSGSTENSTDEPYLLTLDVFQMVSDWYHFAIIALVECRDFRPEPKHVASRLGITEFEAEEAISRLIRLKILERKSGTLIKQQKLFTTPADVPSQALKNFHLQMLEKAKQALELQPVEEREISGITLSVSEDKLPIAKAEIKKFRRKMAKILDSSSPRSVYQLNLQFFKLSSDRLKPGSILEGESTRIPRREK